MEGRGLTVSVPSSPAAVAPRSPSDGDAQQRAFLDATPATTTTGDGAPPRSPGPGGAARAKLDVQQYKRETSRAYSLAEIERVQATNASNLYLCSLCLTNDSLPDELRELAHLKWLSICDNELTHVPSPVLSLLGT